MKLKILIFLIVLGSFLIKTIHGQELFFWNVDEDLIALTAKRILVDKRPQLIGFPIPGGLYLGPMVYYIISFFYLLVALNPLKLYIYSALFGAISTFLVYYVGREIFEKKSIGIIASIFFGFSYLTNVYSHVFTGLTFVPIFTLLSYLFIYRYLKNRKAKYLFLLLSVLIVASQNEGTSLSLIVLSIILMIIYKIKIPTRKILTGVSIFIFFQVPLLIFDLKHNWFVSKSFINFFSKEHGLSTSDFSLGIPFRALEIFPHTFSRFLLISGPNNITEQILPCFQLLKQREDVPLWMMFISILAISFFLKSIYYKKKKRIGETIILFHFLIILIGILIYNLIIPGYFYEWMLVIFFPALSLIAAYLITSLEKFRLLGKLITVLIIIIFLSTNLKLMIKSTGNFGLLEKTQAVKFAASKIDNRKFSLKSIGSCFGQGYLYLFWYYGHLPIKSEGLIYDQAYVTSDENSDAKVKIILANHSEFEDENFYKEYNFFKSQSTNSKKFGGVEVLIIEKDYSFD